MTGGFDDRYGSGSSSPIPTEGSDEERGAHPEADGAPEPAEGAPPYDGIPRHSRPFRAWGAAQDRDPDPSLWERFTAWLRSIFAKKQGSDEDESSDDIGLGAVDGDAPPRTMGLGIPRSSFDDLDAPWNEDPYPVQERRSSRPSRERPSVDDFATSWDGTYGREEEPDFEPEVAAGESSPAASAPAAETDPLWDAPIVSASSAAPPQAFDAQELDAVWTPRADEQEVEAPAAEPPKKGFFARLFGRKEAPAPEPEATAWTSDADAATDDSARALEPADADFADDLAAAAVPVDDDFASAPEPVEADGPDEEVIVAVIEDSVVVEEVVVVEESVGVEEVVVQEPPPVPPAAEKRPSFIGRLFGRKKAEPAAPSIDHSAEDSANLAALLGPIDAAPATDESAPTEFIALDSVPAVDVEPASIAEEFVESIPEEVVEATVVESVEAETSVDVAAAFAVASEPPIVEDTVDRSLSAGALPDIEFTEPVEPMPVAEPAKKPGFFSSLLKRVSRSQFVSKPAVEPEPPVDEAPALGAEAPADVEEVVEVHEAYAEVVETPAAPAEDLAAKWGPPAEPDFVEAPVAPLPTPPANPELDSTQPFPAFRDARDDFGDEAAAPVTDSRPTEQVDIPAFVEGEKTDEFQVVPAEGEAEAPPEPEVTGFFGRLFRKKAAVSGEGVAVPAVEDKVPFVLAKFRHFYNEVIRDKHQKSDVISGFATAVLSAPAADMADPEFAAQLLSKRLSEMLELQAAESNWTGGDAVKYYPEAQFAMVALADETFANIDWPGRSSWHKYMLEPRMYGTRGADLEFFKRIDKLLKDPDPPQGARDLARVYLLVIASGFRGKFRVPNVKRPLAEYRRRLYEFSHQADPLELYARDRRIFPEAAAHTLASRAVGRFTPAQKWVAAVLFLILVYLGVSHYAWVRLSTDLEDVMSRIQSSITQPAPPR